MSGDSVRLIESEAREKMLIGDNKEPQKIETLNQDANFDSLNNTNARNNPSQGVKHVTPIVHKGPLWTLPTGTGNSISVGFSFDRGQKYNHLTIKNTEKQTIWSANEDGKVRIWARYVDKIEAINEFNVLPKCMDNPSTGKFIDKIF
jgi:hypothetical protein